MWFLPESRDTLEATTHPCFIFGLRFCYFGSCCLDFTFEDPTNKHGKPSAQNDWGRVVLLHLVCSCIWLSFLNVNSNTYKYTKCSLATACWPKAEA